MKTKITAFPVQKDNIARVNIDTKGGNYLSVFYNADSNLLVIDLCAADGKGGNEIVRMALNEKRLLGQ